MCDGQLSDTIFALWGRGPRVGCFIMPPAYYSASQRIITQPVGCASSAKCDLGHWVLLYQHLVDHFLKQILSLLIVYMQRVQEPIKSLQLFPESIIVSKWQRKNKQQKTWFEGFHASTRPWAILSLDVQEGHLETTWLHPSCFIFTKCVDESRLFV